MAEHGVVNLVPVVAFIRAFISQRPPELRADHVLSTFFQLRSWQRIREDGRNRDLPLGNLISKIDKTSATRSGSWPSALHGNQDRGSSHFSGALR